MICRWFHLLLLTLSSSRKSFAMPFPCKLILCVTIEEKSWKSPVSELVSFVDLRAGMNACVSERRNACDAAGRKECIYAGKTLGNHLQSARAATQLATEPMMALFSRARYGMAPSKLSARIEPSLSWAQPRRIQSRAAAELAPQLMNAH